MYTLRTFLHKKLNVTANLNNDYNSPSGHVCLHSKVAKSSWTPYIPAVPKELKRSLNPCKMQILIFLVHTLYYFKQLVCKQASFGVNLEGDWYFT
ncbi:unnamed protein product [Larinioides sclopetarius]|uniref:Uncharacterized protein n=1 Tax=Larinioides sclopetarius TaxID=280406 RepID=A0AAV2A8J2_9ARAC